MDFDELAKRKRAFAREEERCLLEEAAERLEGEADPGDTP